MEITATKTFTVITCDCGVSYALDDAFIRSRQESHKRFYCPNGCLRVYPAENEKERLQRQLADERRRAMYAESDRDCLKFSLRSQKAAKTRLKNRIAKGICPCCKRTFKNVQRHMESQHPEFAQEASDE